MEMEEEMRRLPDSELAIMLTVWAEDGKEITAPVIMEKVSKPLTASALHSYLKRLVEKGFLSCSKQGKVNHYSALVPKECYSKQEGRCMLERFYENSLRNFTAALYDGGAVSENDLQGLREYLEGIGE